RKGDTDHAIEDFSRAIVQAPQTDIASYFTRGQLFSAKGDYARAIADFDKVLSIAPNGPAAQAAQQQRQSAIATQAELAKVRGGQPAAAPSPAASGSPAPSASPTFGAMEPISPAQVLSSAAIRDAQQLMTQRKYADAAAKLTGVLATDPRNETALRL